MPGLLTSRRSSHRSNSNHSSASPSPERPTIHHRRTLSRHSSSRKPPPPPLTGLGLPDTFFATNSRRESTLETQQGESDAECWSRMLMLQREYHCYNSARLEAAVEALERGWRIEEVPMPSRLCLDLLNEELEQRMEARSLI